MITGGARGIGAAIAKLLAKEGSEVIIADILESEGREVAESINIIAKDNKQYGSARFYYLDVSYEEN